MMPTDQGRGSSRVPPESHGNVRSRERAGRDGKREGDKDDGVARRLEPSRTRMDLIEGPFDQADQPLRGAGLPKTVYPSLSALPAPRPPPVKVFPRIQTSLDSQENLCRGAGGGRPEGRIARVIEERSKG